jgi:hypothetical protein
VACPALPHFSTLSHKRHDLLKKVIEHIKCVLISSITLSVTSGKNSARYYHKCRRPDSSVGIATGYELDGPGIESRCGRDFSHTSRPALVPTQGPGCGAYHPPPSSAKVKKE